MKLKVKQCENAGAGPRAYKLSDGRGLVLEIMPNGSKFFRLRYRFGGNEKTLSLGKFPELKLEKARLYAEEARANVRSGIDPSAAKQEEKRLRVLNSENTFAAVAVEWHEQEKSRWDKKHAQNILSRMKRDLFPAIGNIPIADMKPTDIASVIRKIDNRGLGETARRALQNCGQVMRYAVQTGRAQHNVTADLTRGLLKPRNKKHYAAINIKELPELVKKIRGNDVQLFRQTRIALELMMLTFVRTSELINAKWDEFDFEDRVWIIPAERMKMRQEHRVPLCRQACELLGELNDISGHREHLFPSIPRPLKSMSNATLLRALEKLDYKGVMTGHGFRALATTAIQEKLGYDFSVVDRQLAHRPKGAVNQAYDRAQFLDKRVRMMQDWADYIDECAKDDKEKPRSSELFASNSHTGIKIAA